MLKLCGAMVESEDKWPRRSTHIGRVARVVARDFISVQIYFVAVLKHICGAHVTISITVGGDWSGGGGDHVRRLIEA